jgi:hypothetical protein
MSCEKAARFHRFLFTLLLFLNLLILSGCADRIIEDEGAIEKLAANGKQIPKKAVRLNWTEFLDAPDQYRDQYVEIKGWNGSTIIGTCWKPGGPPVDWFLHRNNPWTSSLPFIYVQNVFDYSIIDSEFQKVSVWGYMRKYQGKDFCSDSETVYWYIESIKFRVDESKSFQIIRENLARWYRDAVRKFLDETEP